MNTKLVQKGYEIIENVYSIQEIDDILAVLAKKGVAQKFGVRSFLTDNPEISKLVFTKKLVKIMQSIAPNAQPIKSIYFDKPPSANWIVNWHQDLTINVREKKETLDFKNWRVTKERTVVQPSIDILENIFTIRIHLDDCIKENGALKVIEKSHNKGVIPIIEWHKNKSGIERICEVKKGGILLMKPLILHSSNRTENNKNRRVIHIEFCNKLLPNELKWLELIETNLHHYSKS